MLILPKSLLYKYYLKNTCVKTLSTKPQELCQNIRQHSEPINLYYLHVLLYCFLMVIFNHFFNWQSFYSIEHQKYHKHGKHRKHGKHGKQQIHLNCIKVYNQS